MNTEHQISREAYRGALPEEFQPTLTKKQQAVGTTPRTTTACTSLVLKTRIALHRQCQYGHAKIARGMTTQTLIHPTTSKISMLILSIEKFLIVYQCYFHCFKIINPPNNIDAAHEKNLNSPDHMYNTLDCTSITVGE